MDRVKNHFHRDNKFSYEIYKNGKKYSNYENAETMKNLSSISCCLFSPPPPAALNSAAPLPIQRKKLDFLGHIHFLWTTFHHDSLGSKLCIPFKSDGGITSSSSVCSEFSPFPKVQESTCAMQCYSQRHISLSIPYLLPKDALYLSGGLEGSHSQ